MNDNSSWLEVSAQEQYITRRVMDAFLREDIREIVSQGTLCPASQLTAHWPLDRPQHWLKINHLGTFTLYLPVNKSSFIQPWRVQTSAWLYEQDGQYSAHNHYNDWLEQLATGLSDEQSQYYRNYLDECHCAVNQKSQAMQLFEQQSNTLDQPITTLGDGWQQMSLIEQLAAHCDHPLYPTARAKFGLADSAIETYCPEAMGQFELNWLAVPKVLHHASMTQTPDVWPTFEQVGLSPQLTEDHALVPLHPLTAEQYLPQTLKDWAHCQKIHFAPKPFLMVRPTLSVRTVALVDRPEVHIKLPLPMRTLGSKNIRTIKPSTINDGFVFQQLLQQLAVCDEQLNRLYLHSDEQNGGHVDGRADLAWLLRRYPAQTASTTPVCVAAFMAQAPNGKLVIEQLAESYYDNDLTALLEDYFALLLKVHIRLCLVYGIALESNQQNTLVLFGKDQPLQLLFRDNDAGRINPQQLQQTLEGSEHWLARFIDQRILVEGQLPLIQMFTTINLQLNIGCIIDGLVERNLVDAKQQYACLRQLFEQELSSLQAQGYDGDLFRSVVLDAPHHYAKYLLTAASLMSKQQSQAADINKYYGLSAPNPLLAAKP